MQFYNITQLCTIILVHFFSIYFYLSCTEPLINTSERSLFEVFFEKFIDALIGIWRIIEKKRNHKKEENIYWSTAKSRAVFVVIWGNWISRDRRNPYEYPSAWMSIYWEGIELGKPDILYSRNVIFRPSVVGTGRKRDNLSVHLYLSLIHIFSSKIRIKVIV